MPAYHLALAHQGVLGRMAKRKLEAPALTRFGNTMLGSRVR